MKFSIVVTVLNEEESIGVLLDSLVNQSLRPKEIIIVDAGSNDQTSDIIESKKNELKKVGIGLKLMQVPGINRSKGRNVGIEASTCQHIAVTDAGCEADSRWLEYLGEGFGKGADSVAGFYLPIIKKPIHKLFAAYVATSSSQFNEKIFLPSSRSLAFTKEAWEKAGKYPAKLNTCEDLVFAKQLDGLNTMKVQKKALVYWRQADGLSEFYRQIKGYARGDVEASYMPHVRKIFTVWLRYLLFIAYPPLFIIYLAYPVVKFRKLANTTKDWLLLPIVQITSDIGVMVGSFEGLMSSKTL